MVASRMNLSHRKEALFEQANAQKGTAYLKVWWKPTRSTERDFVRVDGSIVKRRIVGLTHVIVAFTPGDDSEWVAFEACAKHKGCRAKARWAVSTRCFDACIGVPVMPPIGARDDGLYEHELDALWSLWNGRMCLDDVALENLDELGLAAKGPMGKGWELTTAGKAAVAERWGLGMAEAAE